MLTVVTDGESIGTGAGINERMSVEIGAEHSSGIRGCGDDVHTVSNWKSGVRVAPVGRRQPLCLRRHRLGVEHYICSVGSLGRNGYVVGEIDTVLQCTRTQQFDRIYVSITYPQRITRVYEWKNMLLISCHIPETEYFSEFFYYLVRRICC